MQLITDKKGHDYYIPLYFMITLTFAFWFFVVMVENIRKGRSAEVSKVSKASKASSAAANPINEYLIESEKKSNLPQSMKSRVQSIDVFRGITICIMIFANYGAGQYSHSLVHAAWDGITFADFAFPL